jgi:hypothetical protein
VEQTPAVAPSRWRTVVEIAALVGPAGILTGILYYFGYISAKAFYSYFGVSLSALNFSPTNYLVRSTDTFFRPVATLLIFVLVVFVSHHLLGQLLGRVGHHRARWVMFGLCGATAVLAGFGLSGLYGEPLGLVSPLSLAASAALMEYSVLIAVRYASLPAAMRALLHAGVGLRRGLLAALVLIAIFWAVTNLAQERGTTNARLAELALPLQPQAVVYSEKDLHLPGPGVAVTNLNGDNSAYRFRYNGLRPLLYANGRWFLLPVGWKRDNGSTVIVLQDDPGRVRIDLAP